VSKQPGAAICSEGGEAMSDIPNDAGDLAVTPREQAMFWLNDLVGRGAKVHAEVKIASGDFDTAVLTTDGVLPHAGSERVEGLYSIGKSDSASIDLSDVPDDAEAIIRDDLGELTVRLDGNVGPVV
jgi:hypothetical protein